MEIVGTSLSAAQTLLKALQCPQLKNILEIIGYESQLEDLKHTVEAVTAVLRDAEKKIDLSEHTQFLIEELKDAVFEADDLLDEFVTLAEQNRVLKVEGRLSEKVRSFFSGSNPLGVAYRMSRGVKKIRKKLDAIAYNKQFNFEHDPAPIRNRSRETCSYVNEVDIIGRDDDLEHIVGTLLDDSDVRHNVGFLSIVGIGGLGKTALAQLIFNDQRVVSSFPIRLWTCVADQDQKQLDVKGILRMILASIDKNLDPGSTLDQIQRQLLQKLAGATYLLVLDDVWTEDRHQWCELVKYLTKGERGSWIVVTTRSQATATIIDGLKYELLGLSKDNSWRLFEKTAFASDQPNPPLDLANIGREIVDGCSGVPLAIRVAGSLLYGQNKSKWVSVQKTGIANIRDDKNGIMPILKLSFHHLESPLKSCFSYCALFPKDFKIEKEKLINLWMAQGYIVPLDNGQTIGDAAEEYFSILLRRCFFQDIQEDPLGEIYSCKIHDLMHDIAQSVSRMEIYTLNTTNSDNESNIKARHLSIAGTREYGKYPFGKTHIRSHLFVDSTRYSWFPIEVLVANCRWLRALDLRFLGLRSLPSSIGALLHLRYLDMSFNQDLVELPSTITKLYNLQTLNLSCCHVLKELPNDLCRLRKLRVLDIEDCYRLTYMPEGMGKMTNLERLIGWYVLGGEGRCSSWKEWFYGVEDLKTLSSLKEQLKIKIMWPKKVENNHVCKHDHWSWREGLNLNSSVKHLNSIILDFQDHKENDGIITRLMEELQPHPNLKKLVVLGYNGVKMPSWANPTSLPHLAKLYLDNCEVLEYLPLFPSLKVLELENMPKLKGVLVEESSSSSNDSNPQFQQSLPCLSKLDIRLCPELICILHCPRLKFLHLWCEVERIRIICPKVKKVTVDKMAWLNLTPIETLKSIRYLDITINYEVEYLPSCIQCLSSLQILIIHDCACLEAMPNWMPKLASLRKFQVFNCSDSMWTRCQQNPPGMYWPYIQHIPYINILSRTGKSLKHQREISGSHD